MYKENIISLFKSFIDKPTHTVAFKKYLKYKLKYLKLQNKNLIFNR